MVPIEKSIFLKQKKKKDGTLLLCNPFYNRDYLLKIVSLSFAGMSFLLSYQFARAQDLNARYAVSVGSLSVGQATLKASIKAHRYQAQATMTFIGLAGLFTDMKAAMSSFGNFSGNHIQPSQFLAKAKSGEQERIIQFSVIKGNAHSVNISPSLPYKTTSIPMEAKHRRSIIDPLSSMIMPIKKGKDAFHPQNCERTLPIFDGGTRFTITLHYKGVRNVQKKGYKGKVLVCSAQYTPISGYQMNSSAVHYMKSNKNMEVSLAPLPNAPYLLPIHVRIQTSMGAVMFDAMRWETSKDFAGSF